MGHIDVDVIHAETFKTQVNLVQDGVAGEIFIELDIPDLVEKRALAIPDNAELCDDAHLLAVHLFQRLADKDLAVAEVVARRGVEHIDAGLGAGADCFNAAAFGFRLLFGVLPPRGAAADGPCTKADAGNGFFNGTDLYVFHSASPK